MINSVQYLRALAALFVVLSHISIKGSQYSISSFSWFKIGESGVDLFFIISGFIMCYTTHKKKIGFANFIFARFRRILPLYWLMTTLALLVFIFYPSLINSSGGQTSIFSSYSLIPNGDKYLVQNGWTLSFEFLFYFIFALSLLSKKNNLITCSILLLLLCSLRIFLNGDFIQAHPLIRFITNTIILEFILGIISFKLMKFLTHCFYIKYILLISGIGSLFLQNTFGQYEAELGRLVYYGIPMFFLFTGVVSFEDKFTELNNKKSMRLLELLGNSSYSIYLIHPFILSPILILGKSLGLLKINYLFSFLMISLSLVAGVITYLYIEKPMDRLLKKKKFPSL